MHNQSANGINKNSFTYLHWFSLVFTLFSLYLMGDAFYRWDAFKFHSTFWKYLPNVALAFIIWSIVALLCSIFSWMSMKAFQLVCGYLGFRIKAEHQLLYLFIFILLAALTWIGKKIIWSDFQTSVQLKLVVILFISCAVIPLTWLFRNKGGMWIHVIQERVLPLTWFFASCLVLSLLTAGYYMWGHKTSKTVSQELTKSTASGSDQIHPNILLVTFDTLTARNMSVYGYNRDTTPFLKKWAKTASLFTRTQAESNYTAATTPSLMTGKRTWTHRKYHHDLAAKPLKVESENLPLLMKENGYHTSAYIANFVTSVEALGISHSMDIAPSVSEFLKPASMEGIIAKHLFLLFGDKFSIYNWLGQDDFLFTILLRKIPQQVYTTEFPPELAFNKFLETMDKNPRKPFFAWIHLMPPHAPQSPPEPFAGTFNPSQELREKNIQYSFRPEIVHFDSRNLPWPKEVKRKVTLLRDYYDEFILYCDNQFENFITTLGEKSWSRNTIIIVSSDHGESFEHDYFLHKPTHLYEQVTHIPLIIKEPGQTGGKTIDHIVEQVDIPATILDLANISIPSWMEGRSLMPLLRGREIQAQPAISVSLYKNAVKDPITKGIIAVWEDDYKLIHYLDSKKSLLFNLREDPRELNNLFKQEQGTGQRVLDIIKINLTEANRRIMAEN
jgi:arylsulfatase A-like enzyme